MKDKKSKMSITMYFSYGLLVLALILILCTKKDEKTTDDDNLEHLEEMNNLNKENVVANKIE